MRCIVRLLVGAIICISRRIPLRRRRPPFDEGDAYNRRRRSGEISAGTTDGRAVGSQGEPIS